MKRAVVLVSGGLDSAVTLAICVADGNEAHALSFRYGQRHAVEIESAKRVANTLGAVEHRFAEIDLRVFGGSALTDDIAVPQERAETEIGHGYGIPVTYVPARNTIFLSYALAYAEVIGAADIFIGVNSVDYSDYPDCRGEFLRAFEEMASLATKVGVEGTRIRINAPLLQVTKAEIIRKGVSLGVDFSITHSCYDPAPDGISCGRCDSCLLRLKGFREAGLTDPIRYATW
ncbi:MAG: 7-cyano-7-deazaguanine synthase QueC [Verrucomicrobiota bacterium]|nr:7-cyano-7-deazaguanine synthase QueC [Verrucomicrobiota bacterium]